MPIPGLTASNRILCEESERLGFHVTAITGADTVLIHEGHGLRFYTRGTQTSVQSSVGRTIAFDKALAKALLVHHGLPTARGFLATTEADLDQLAGLEAPYVVKPVDGKQGVGVTVGLPDAAAVRSRFMVRTGPVVVEELLRGTEYRVVCIAGEVVAVACRRAAFVTGDGQATIAALVAQKNTHPWRGAGHLNNLTAITFDDGVHDQLASLNLTVASIPAAGQDVPLRRAANLSLGGEAVDVTDAMSPQNRALMGQVARAVDLDIVGIDVICASLSDPIAAQPHAGVVEVNASPGLRMHHFPMSGTPRNVGRLVLEHVIARLGGRR